jgi:DNA-binding transcriptional LysR family regulator
LRWRQPPAYLDRRGRPEHPRDLLGHDCIARPFRQRAMPPWEFERATAKPGAHRRDRATDRARSAGRPTSAVDAAMAGTGIVYLFEDWLRPHFESGALEPILEPWWPSFSGPFLYYPGRRLLPAPLRAFVDFIQRAP